MELQEIAGHLRFGFLAFFSSTVKIINQYKALNSIRSEPNQRTERELTSSLARERLVEMYREMLRIRYFEEKVFELYGQNLVPGTIHLYAGEEAVAVGVCSSLREEDYVASTHRGHGHCIAKGADLRRRSIDRQQGDAPNGCK